MEAGVSGAEVKARAKIKVSIEIMAWLKEDFGHVPSWVDWARAIKHEPWMNKPMKLGFE